jgi:GAF domain-containing protein
VQRKTLVPPTPEEAVAAAPLTVRGEVVGALGVFDDPQRPLSADELALLQEIIEQGSLALESARLYQDTQRRAAREQLVGEVRDESVKRWI